MIFSIIKYVYGKIMLFLQGNNRTPRVSYEDEKLFFDTFDSPQSKIERSYFQYRCQKFILSAKVTFCFMNIISFIFIVPTILCFCAINVFKPKRIHKDCVYTFPSLVKNKLIPCSLSQEYKSFAVMKRGIGRLSINDLKFIWGISTRYPLSIFFLFKCVWMVSVYSYAIYKYYPKAVVCSAEYSFTSSILTSYCERNGVEHINVMHGEKRFNIREAFSSFTRFYVWDEHYIHLFKELKSSARFYVSPLVVPDIIADKTVEYTYYLALHDDFELKRIKCCLESLGANYKVRFHPIDPTPRLLKIFDKDCIESPFEVDIWESIGKSRAVIAQDSTVLFQAYLLHVPVVIDDVSNPDYYNDLKKRQYIMLAKPHTLLSDLMRIAKEYS